MSKLLTCKHRSEDLVQYGPPCCTDKNLGYYCLLRSIHGISDPICDACAFYVLGERKEQHNTIENNGSKS